MSSPPSLSADIEYNATVISHFGNELLIQPDQGERLRAVPRQQLPALAPGDRIRYETGETGLASITAVAERHGILSRHSKHQDKLVAVNIDHVCIVSAAKPSLKTGLIDRYLIACELAGLDAIIVFNKTDLLDTGALESIRQNLSVYAAIGYRTVYVSARSGEGIAELRRLLENATSVLVGHSAVGKSSLIKALIPGAAPRIGEISQASNKGRHTTTHSELYALGNQGKIIDSPGIREFGLKTIDNLQLAQGFREFGPYIDQCKFRDCSHSGEPGCAVAEAVAAGKISPERLASYRLISESFTRPR